MSTQVTPIIRERGVYIVRDEHGIAKVSVYHRGTFQEVKNGDALREVASSQVPTMPGVYPCSYDLAIEALKHGF